jgi:hypothetical protein
MASLEKRGHRFRIVLRYQGARYARALNTRDERAAAGCLPRLEDNLHRLELGTLLVPDDVDLMDFLLGDDGRGMPSVAWTRLVAHREIDALRQHDFLRFRRRIVVRLGLLAEQPWN